jgi:chemotaxis protein MotB
MANSDKKLQPIIVKRIKKTTGGHHGGAWKIAYADFVTAMMAFFLLMWLLGSSTKGELKGISDYFNTPLKVALQGGSGSGDASSVVKGGGQDLTRSAGAMARGDIEATRRSINLQALKAELERQEGETLAALKANVEAVIMANPKLAEFRSQIRIDLMSEGLRIQIVDDQNRAMFDSGSAMVKDYMRDLLRETAQLLNNVPNRISLSGHTDSSPYGSGEKGYSNWELSADRANASRRELFAGGLKEDRIVRVVGLASSIPFEEADPSSPVNRRIAIVVMKKGASDRLLKGTELTKEEPPPEAIKPSDVIKPIVPFTSPTNPVLQK